VGCRKAPGAKAVLSDWDDTVAKRSASHGVMLVFLATRISYNHDYSIAAVPPWQPVGRWATR
jgi:hypothetical protein